MLLLLFVVYLLVLGNLASQALYKFFGLSNNISRRVLGIFAVFVSLGWIAGGAILFLPLHFWVVVAIFVVNALLYISLVRWAKKIETEPDRADHELGGDWISGAKFAAAAFLFIIAYGFYLLYHSATGNAIATPWQTINPQYIVVFFLATCALGLLIFSKLKTNTVLLFLLLQTFLLVSYLPLTHQLIYGADGWRHVANEERFLIGESFLPATLSGGDNQDSQVEIKRRASTDVARHDFVKSKIGELSYSSFWATNVILAKVFNTSLITITKWFLPILWSLVFPLLLFEIALTFGWSKKKSLFFAWLGLLPFAWASAGSFSLPVNFGLLVWLFLILLILKRATSPRPEQKLILALAGVGLVFGYALYFILFWVAWIMLEVLKQIDKHFLAVNQQNRMTASKIFINLFLTLLIAFVFSGLELLFGYSKFDRSINWLAQLRQLLGNFSGFYLASGPRPHNIDFGNVIFNQTPLAAFVPNILTQWRWWLVAFAVCFFAVVFYGLIQFCHNKKITHQWLSIMASGLIVGYAMTNYFLAGSHILTRRLDGALALFLLILFFYGLQKVAEDPVWIKKPYIFGVVILSLVITTSYSLGPDTYTVSVNEYEAAKYVWSREQSVNKPCVLGDTYPLLALETASAKQIIGGGFPIDADFGQPGRVELFAQMNMAINDTVLKKTRELTGSDHCWFIGDTDNFQKQGILHAGDFKIFEDTAVVRYNTKY